MNDIAILADVKNNDDMILYLQNNSITVEDNALLNLLVAYIGYLPDIGYGKEYFQKAFRQQDITDNCFTDMAIWNLIYASQAFRQMLVNGQK